MRRARKGLAGIAVALVATSAWAYNYIWVGNGSDDLWTTCENWWTADEVPVCYPSTTSDTAIFPSNGDMHEVELAGSETIDDLVINGDVQFGPYGSGGPIRILSADTVTIIGQNGGTVVTMSGGGLAQVWTH